MTKNQPRPRLLHGLQRPLKSAYRRMFQRRDDYPLDERFVRVKERLQASKRIIDLGCGNCPIEGACVGVDVHIDPKERAVGGGPASEIDVERLERQNVTFVNVRIDETLPFSDKEFDFAYSHHVFEHVEDPLTACREMMRIAKSGVIITPSILADLLFGRSYHKWLVMDRGNTLMFFRKRPFEDRPFGEHPRWDEGKRNWVAERETNPFEILLNDGNWYRGRQKLPRLAEKVRKHWYSHSPLIEVIFLWEGHFDVEIHD